MSAAEDDVREVVTAESGTLAILNSSEINQQIATARKFPRSIKRARDEALELATLTEDVARECIYALPRKQDGKRITIEGPSARFAEILAHSWGNCRAGARVVDEQGDFVTAQGVFHDLEKNVAITYEVKRRIVNRDGHRFNADMIGVTANAACSIALRNAVLKGVPKALWTDILEAARKVLLGDSKTLATRRAAALAVMQKFGMQADDVCTVLGVGGVDDIGLEELVTMHGMCTALKDGDTTVEQLLAEATGQVVTPQKTSAVSARVRAGSSKPAAEEPAATNKANAGAERGSSSPGEDEPHSSPSAPAAAATQYPYGDLLMMLDDAESQSQLDYLEQQPRDHLTEDEQQNFADKLAGRRAALPPPKGKK